MPCPSCGLPILKGTQPWLVFDGKEYHRPCGEHAIFKIHQNDFKNAVRRIEASVKELKAYLYMKEGQL